MFNNCDSRTNGELTFYKNIEPHINIIFDVGCRHDSEFFHFNGEVHYFDPVPAFIDSVKQNAHNKKGYFNPVGLSDKNEERWYYPKYQSFYDRIASCKHSDDANKVLFKTVTGKDYMNSNNLTVIDFLKIDTEGHEFSVIKGFSEKLEDIKIIQFEYGGTFMDNNIKLVEVINYLREAGFSYFSYLTSSGCHKIVDFADHYQYCNIVCLNTKYPELLHTFA